MILSPSNSRTSRLQVATMLRAFLSFPLLPPLLPPTIPPPLLQQRRCLKRRRNFKRPSHPLRFLALEVATSFAEHTPASSILPRRRHHHRRRRLHCPEIIITAPLELPTTLPLPQQCRLMCGRAKKTNPTLCRSHVNCICIRRRRRRLRRLPRRGSNEAEDF